MAALVLVGNGMLVGATPAAAQSSITLYGATDTGVAYFGSRAGTGGRGGAVQMHAGNLAPDLWGIKGIEDLGGGLTSMFKLESGFDIDNGRQAQGGRLFGRTAIVGLGVVAIGTVTVGRQYDPLIDLIQPLTNADTFASTFATPGDMDNFDNSYRTNNAIKFTTPDLDGLQGAAMYALGGAPGATAGRTYAFAAAYHNGPLGIGAGYFNANSADGTMASFDGLRPNTDVDVDSPAVTGGFVSADSLQIIRAAAHYQLEQWGAGFAYSHVRYGDYRVASGRQATTTFNTAQAFLNYQVNAATIVGIGYDITKGAGDDVNVRYDQWSLGADYRLSPSTDLYALAGYQHASGMTMGVSGTLVPAVASMGDFGIDAATNRQAMAMIGVRHLF
ncbi:porin [Burkholderia ubonensis]|uniref:porin n=1 Tax=Burkholderia ubonensis TaxID=101571 RepID=UPI0018E0DFEE|nr:porin [Burkholderia ubonensis]